MSTNCLPVKLLFGRNNGKYLDLIWIISDLSQALLAKVDRYNFFPHITSIHQIVLLVTSTQSFLISLLKASKFMISHRQSISDRLISRHKLNISLGLSVHLFIHLSSVKALSCSGSQGVVFKFPVRK